MSAATAKKAAVAVALSDEQIDDAIRLLATLRVHLQAAVESTLIPGERQPKEEIDLENVVLDRADIRKARALIKALQALLRGGSV